MAFRIDPAQRQVRWVGLDDEELTALKDRDPVYLNDSGDVIYEGRGSDHYFVIEGVRRPLCGVSYIVGTTIDGEDCEPSEDTSLEWLCGHLDFGTASGGMYFGDAIVRAIQ